MNLLIFACLFGKQLSLEGPVLNRPPKKISARGYLHVLLERRHK